MKVIKESQLKKHRWMDISPIASQILGEKRAVDEFWLGDGLDPLPADEWLDKFIAARDMESLSEGDKILLIGTRLKLHAQDWFSRRIRIRATAEDISLTQFRAEFSREFPDSLKAMVRNRMSMCYQEATVLTYNENFKRLLDRLLDQEAAEVVLNEQEVNLLYLDGLYPRYRVQVEFECPRDWIESSKLAVLAERIWGSLGTCPTDFEMEQWRKGRRIEAQRMKQELRVQEGLLGSQEVGPEVVPSGSSSVTPAQGRTSSPPRVPVPVSAPAPHSRWGTIPMVTTGAGTTGQHADPEPLPGTTVQHEQQLHRPGWATFHNQLRRVRRRQEDHVRFSDIYGTQPDQGSPGQLPAVRSSFPHLSITDSQPPDF